MKRIVQLEIFLFYLVRRMNKNGYSVVQNYGNLLVHPSGGCLMGFYTLDLVRETAFSACSSKTKVLVLFRYNSLVGSTGINFSYLSTLEHFFARVSYRSPKRIRIFYVERRFFRSFFGMFAVFVWHGERMFGRNSLHTT